MQMLYEELNLLKLIVNNGRIRSGDAAKIEAWHRQAKPLWAFLGCASLGEVEVTQSHPQARPL